MNVGNNNDSIYHTKLRKTNVYFNKWIFEMYAACDKLDMSQFQGHMRTWSVIISLLAENE